MHIKYNLLKLFTFFLIRKMYIFFKKNEFRIKTNKINMLYHILQPFLFLFLYIPDRNNVHSNN